MPDFTQSPAFQRMQQRIMALSPEQRAILSTAQGDLESLFAKDAMKDELAAREAGSQRDYRNRLLDIRGQQLDNSGALGRDKLSLGMEKLALERTALDDQEAAARRAENIGLAGLGVSGALGYGQMQARKRQAAENDALLRRLGI